MENISVFGELGLVLQVGLVFLALFCHFTQPVSSFSFEWLYFCLPLLLSDNSLVFRWGRLGLAHFLPIGLEEPVVHLANFPKGMPEEIGVARDVLIELTHLLTADF